MVLTEIHLIIGARQKGDSKWEKPVPAKICGFSAVSCENLRFPAVFCRNLRLPNPLIYRASRKSAKICENVRSGSGFSLLLSPFWRALIHLILPLDMSQIWAANLGKHRKFVPKLPASWTNLLHGNPKWAFSLAPKLISYIGAT